MRGDHAGPAVPTLQDLGKMMRVTLTCTLPDVVRAKTILHLLPGAGFHEGTMVARIMNSAPNDGALVVRASEHPLHHAHRHPWPLLPADRARLEAQEV